MTAALAAPFLALALQKRKRHHTCIQVLAAKTASCETVLRVDGNAVLPEGYVLIVTQDSTGRGFLKIKCNDTPKGLISITIKAGRDEKHANSEPTYTWKGTHKF